VDVFWDMVHIVLDLRQYGYFPLEVCCIQILHLEKFHHGTSTLISTDDRRGQPTMLSVHLCAQHYMRDARLARIHVRQLRHFYRPIV